MGNTLKLGNGNWATKKDSLLAYNDENNNFKPLPFEFERASSATVVNKDGLIETVGSGQPRIDYSDDAKGALKLEPQRTNLVYPSDIGTPTSGVGVRNYLAPDGTTSAFYPQPTSTARRFQVIIVGGAYATNTKLTYSWYRKRVSTPSSISYIGDLDIKVLINATQVGVTEQIESNVSGYDRFSATFNVTDGSLETTLRLYYGNVISVGNSSIAYWGHQLEEGSYATSYIPTQGSAVTRLADVCTNGANEQVINSTEGVLYAEFSLISQDGIIDRVIAIQRGSAQSCKIRFLSSGTLRWTLIGNDTTIARSLTLTNTNINKVAIRYNSASASIWINGSLADTANNGMTYTGLDELTFIGFYSKTKDVRVYNTALTDNELQKLTTI